MRAGEGEKIKVQLVSDTIENLTGTGESKKSMISKGVSMWM